MIAGLLKKFFGDKSAKDTKEYQPIIDKANQFSTELNLLSDDELRAMIDEFDKDGDGEINENEFLSIMKQTSIY